MKKTFFSMPNALLLHTLTTFLIGIGCTYPLSLSLGLTAPLSLSVGCCALVTLAFALLSCLPRLRALLVVICALVFSLRGQMNAVSAALTLLLNGHALALAAYSRALVVLFSLVFTGVGAALSRSEQAFFPLMKQRNGAVGDPYTAVGANDGRRDLGAQRGKYLLEFCGHVF